MTLAAVVLAAGGSARLGQPKQLLWVDGAPLLSRTLDLVRYSPHFSTRVVVLGGAYDAIIDHVRLDQFDVVYNRDFGQGQSTSLASGIDALPGDTSGALILLGDQPMLPPGLIERLVEAFEANSDATVQPVYDGVPGNPVLLNRSLFADVQRVTGDVGARPVLAKNRAAIRQIDVTGWPMPQDVDVRDDHEALLESWASLGAPEVPQYCQRCGEKMHAMRRHGRLRPVCPACDFTAFFDPKLSAATIVEIDGRIVMMKRAGDPGRGLWTFPSGFVDRGERVEQAAAREVAEEVGISVDDLELFGVYSEPGETVALVVFHANANGQQPSRSDEADEVALVDPDDLPELAFPRDREIVRQWKRQRVRR